MFDLKFINKLKPCVWRYKENNKLGLETARLHLGFLAQEVREILDSDEYALVQMTDKGYFALDKEELIAPMVKAIQEISNKMNNLEDRISKLEEK